MTRQYYAVGLGVMGLATYLVAFNPDPLARVAGVILFLYGIATILIGFAINAKQSQADLNG